jgi:hypothetical protein
MTKSESKLVVGPDGNIVKYDDILPTTRTVIAITNLSIDIQAFFKYMPITDYTPVEKRRGRKRRVQPPIHMEILKSGSIVSMQYGDIIKGVSLKKKKYKKVQTQKKADDYFRHSVSCVMMLDGNKQINIKVPTNGKLQMTGCKIDEHAVEAVTNLYKTMVEVEKWTNTKLFSKTDAEEELKVIYKVVMQNKDFKIGFRINRQNLDYFINTKTNFYSIFEASTFTGNQIKIEINQLKNKTLLQMKYNYKTDTTIKEQIPYEEYYKLLDEKDREKERELEQEKKYLTFFVFSTGSVVMSERETNMKDLFYEVVSILIKNRHEFEDLSYDRKLTKLKKKRTKIEVIPEDDCIDIEV